MKAKIDYKSKRTIAIFSVAAIVLVAAIAGTVAFTRGNRRATAAVDNATSTTQTAENQGTTEETPNEEPVPLEVNNNKENNSNVANNGQNSSATSNNGANTNAQNGTSGNAQGNGTGTSQTDGNVPNSDYTQTTVIPGETRLVAEESINEWVPLSLAGVTASARLNINKPDLSQSEKIAYVNGNEKVTAAQKGDKITYVIKVKNTSETVEANNIKVYDTVPEGVKVDETSISNHGELSEGKITWKVNVGTQESVELSFDATVTADEFSTIKNTAKINGTDTNEAATPVITSEKKFVVLDKEGNEVHRLSEDGKTEIVKVGETIRYSIVLNNNSEADGTTVVKDTVPAGTTLASEIKLLNGENVEATISEEELKNGSEISLPKNTVKTVTFDVTVNDVNASIKNKATVGGTETEETETKVANIKTEKTSTPSKTPLHENDTIKYVLTAENTGNAKGSVVVTDTIPVGTTLEGAVKVEETEYAETDLNNGITLELEANETKTVEFTVRINSFKEGDENVTKTEDGKIVRTITNTAAQDGEDTNTDTETVEKEFVTVNATKSFVEKDNYDEKRPEEVEVVLTVNGKQDANTQITLNDENGWTVVYANLDKYTENGTEIEYSVEEINVDENYTAESTVSKSEDKNEVTVSVVNTLKNEVIPTSITANKVWAGDEGNEDKRSAVTIGLYKVEGETKTKVGESLEANESSNWQVTFNDVQKYNANGTEIEYTVKEENELDYYTASVNGMTITNTFNNPEVEAHKTAVVLDKEGNEVHRVSEDGETEIVKVGETIRYTISVENKTEQATVKEVKDTVPVSGTTLTSEIKLLNGESVEKTYTAEELTSGVKVDLPANTSKTITFDVRVNDVNASIKNKATVGGTETEETETKVANIKTEKTSTPSKTPLHENDTIKYTLTAENTGNAKGSVVVTDTIPVGTTLEGAVKVGETEYTETDLNNGITLELEANETKTIEFTVRINSFKEGDENVTKTEDGKIVRTITNTAAQDGENTNTETETVEKEFVTITANKVWDDKETDETREVKSVDIKLFPEQAENGTKTANADNNWTVTFEGLDKYTQDGTEIQYSVDEVNVPKGYKKEISGYTITNRLPRLELTKEFYSLNGTENDPEETTIPTVVKGDVVGYKITVKNTGNVDLEGITVTDEMENGKQVYLDVNNPEQKTNTIASNLSIAAGDSEVIYVYYTVEEEDVANVENTLRNTATATTTYNEEDVSATDDETVGVTESPDLYVNKSQFVKNGDTERELSKESTEKLEPGTTLKYVITVRNNGNVKQNNIVISDEMKIGSEDVEVLSTATVVVDNNKGYTVNDDNTVTINELGLNETATITVEYTLSEEDMATTVQTISNTVNAKSDKTDKEDTVTVETEEWKADITVAKTSSITRVGANPLTDNTKVQPGDLITYTITATNTGRKAGTATITDTVPTGTTLKRDGTTNLTAEELNALETEAGLTKVLTVPGKTGNTNGTAQIVFTVEVTAKAGTVENGIKNRATAVVDGETTNPEDPGYDVEKKLKVIKNTTTPGAITNSNVVIVLDASDSMNNRVSWSWYSKTRLEVAKEVVNNFIDQVDLGGKGAGSTISVVKFYGDPQYNWWGDIEYQIPTAEVLDNNLGTDGIARTASDASQLKRNVNAMETGGNTPIHTGLDAAKEQLSKMPAGNKNIVIFVGDGANTDSASEVATSAASLKSVATVYAVGFESDIAILKNTVATDAAHYLTTSENKDLSDVFNEIGKDISTPLPPETPTTTNGKYVLTGLNPEKEITIKVNGVEVAKGLWNSESIGNRVVKIGNDYVLDTTAAEFGATDQIEVEYTVISD